LTGQQYLATLAVMVERWYQRTPCGEYVDCVDI
jgi:hypothetical protein